MTTVRMPEIFKTRQSALPCTRAQVFASVSPWGGGKHFTEQYQRSDRYDQRYRNIHGVINVKKHKIFSSFVSYKNKYITQDRNGQGICRTEKRHRRKSAPQYDIVFARITSFCRRRRRNRRRRGNCRLLRRRSARRRSCPTMRDGIRTYLPCCAWRCAWRH